MACETSRAPGSSVGRRTQLKLPDFLNPNHDLMSLPDFLGIHSSTRNSITSQRRRGRNERSMHRVSKIPLSVDSRRRGQTGPNMLMAQKHQLDTWYDNSGTTISSSTRVTSPKSARTDLSYATPTPVAKSFKRKRRQRVCSECRSKKLRCDKIKPNCTSRSPLRIYISQNRADRRSKDASNKEHLAATNLKRHTAGVKDHDRLANHTTAMFTFGKGLRVAATMAMLVSLLKLSA